MEVPFTRDLLASGHRELVHLQRISGRAQQYAQYSWECFCGELVLELFVAFIPQEFLLLPTAQAAERAVEQS